MPQSFFLLARLKAKCLAQIRHDILKHNYKVIDWNQKFLFEVCMTEVEMTTELTYLPTSICMGLGLILWHISL